MIPQLQLLSIAKDQKFEGFYLVKAAQQKASQNGGKYLDMTLADISGEVNAKLWDGTIEPPKCNTVVKIRGQMLEYNGKAQIRIGIMRSAKEEDAIDMSQLIPCAPRTGDDMLQEILQLVDGFSDADIKAIVMRRLDACIERIKIVPAAVKLHHAERGGLLHHTTTMLQAAKGICEVYTNLDRELLFAGVILHDLCKIEEMHTDEMGLASEYTTEGQLIGHIAMGIAKLDEAGKELGTPRELLVLLEHMILSHHDLPEYGSPKPPMFPEAEVLHTLDQLDARMFEMDRALAVTAEGAFTDKIWSMDRKLYKKMRK